MRETRDADMPCAGRREVMATRREASRECHPKERNVNSVVSIIAVSGVKYTTKPRCLAAAWRKVGQLTPYQRA